MQSQYPDVTVLETLAAKMELPVEKICVRYLIFLCSFYACLFSNHTISGRECWDMFLIKT